MCVTSAEARLSNTTVAAWEQHDPDGSVVHYLGYANRMQNTSPGPNSMLLHIPAVPGTVGRDGFTDGSRIPNVLKNMEDAIPRSNGHLGGFMGVMRGGGSVDVFSVGQYTVLLAEDPRRIPDVLGLVPANRRPRIGEELFDFYAERFPDYAIALCCFDNQEMKKAVPIFVRYTPKDPNILFAPGIDSHTGGVPDLDSKVGVDHTVIFGTDRYDRFLRTDVDEAQRQIDEQMDPIIDKLELGLSEDLKKYNEYVKRQPGTWDREWIRRGMAQHHFSRARAERYNITGLVLGNLRPVSGDTDNSDQIYTPGYPVRYTDPDASTLLALPQRIVGYRGIGGIWSNEDFVVEVKDVRRGIDLFERIRRLQYSF